MCGFADFGIGGFLGGVVVVGGCGGGLGGRGKDSGLMVCFQGSDEMMESEQVVARVFGVS